MRIDFVITVDDIPQAVRPHQTKIYAKLYVVKMFITPTIKVAEIYLVMKKGNTFEYLYHGRSGGVDR